MPRVVFRDHSAKALRAIEQSAEKGLKDGAQEIAGRSDATVPLDTGRLRGSRRIDRLSRLRVALSYNTRYARRQHEETFYRHAPGRRARYLALSASEMQSQAIAVLARALTVGVR